MISLDFLVKFLPKGQSGGGGTSGGGTGASTGAGDAGVSALSASTGDFAIVALIIAAILAIGIGLVYTYYKKRQIAFSTMAHAKSNDVTFFGAVKQNPKTCAIFAIIAALCLCAAFFLGGVKNAIAESTHDGFTATDVEYSYDDSVNSWTVTLACLINENTDASDAKITSIHIDKNSEASDNNIKWQIGEDINNPWFNGSVTSSTDVQGIDVPFSNNYTADDPLYVYAFSDDLTDELCDSLAGKTLFTITANIESLGLYKADAKNELESYKLEAVDFINSLSILDKESFINQINDATDNAINNIDNSQTEEEVNSAKQKGYDDILDICKQATKNSISDYALACTTYIDNIDGLTEDQKNDFKDKIRNSSDKSKTNVDSCKTIEDLTTANDAAIKELDDIVDQAVEASIAYEKDAAYELIANMSAAAVEQVEGLSGLYEGDIAREKNNIEDAKEAAITDIKEAKSVEEINDAVIACSLAFDTLKNQARELSDAKINARSLIRSIYDTTNAAITSSTSLSISARSSLSDELTNNYEASMQALVEADNPDSASQSITIIKDDATKIITENQSIYDDYKTACKRSLDSRLASNTEAINNLEYLKNEERAAKIKLLQDATNKAKNEIDNCKEVSQLDDIDKAVSDCNTQQFEYVRDAAKIDIDNVVKNSINIIISLPGLTDQDKQEAIKDINDKANTDKASLDDLSSDSTPTQSISDIASDFRIYSAISLWKLEINVGQEKENAKDYISDKAKCVIEVIDSCSTMTQEQKDEAKADITKAKDDAIKAVDDAKTTDAIYSARQEMNTESDYVIDAYKLSDDLKPYYIQSIQTLQNDALNALGNLKYLSDDQKESAKKQIIEEYEKAKKIIEQGGSASDITMVIEPTKERITTIVRDTTYFSIDSVKFQATERVTTEFSGLSEKDKNRYVSELSNTAITDESIISITSDVNNIVSSESVYVDEASNTMVDAEAISDTKTNAKQQITSHMSTCKAAIQESTSLTDEEKSYALDTLQKQMDSSFEAIDDSTNVSDTQAQVSTFDNILDSVVSLDKKGEVFNVFKDSVKNAEKTISDDFNNKITYIQDKVGLTDDEMSEISTQFNKALETFNSNVEAATRASEVAEVQNTFNSSLLYIMKVACRYANTHIVDNSCSAIEALNLSEAAKNAHKEQIDFYKIACDESIDGSYSIDRAYKNTDQFLSLANGIVESAKALSEKLVTAKSQIVDKQAASKTEVENLMNLTSAKKSEYNSAIERVATSANENLNLATNTYDIDSIVALSTENFNTVVSSAKDCDAESYWTVKFEMNGHGESPADQQKKYGVLVDKPTNPTAEGYEFKGWYKDSKLMQEWNFTTDKVGDVTSDDCIATLYAKWEGPAPTTCSVTATIDAADHGSVTLSPETINVSPGTSYSLSADGNMIYIGATTEAKNIKYDSGDSTYVLDKWQYRTGDMSDYQDLPTDHTQWIISADIEFKAITKNNAPDVVKSLACTYNGATTYFVPAFSNATDLKDVEFYNSSDQKIDEISNGKCEDMKTMALYYKDGNNDPAKQPVKASAPQGTKFYTTVYTTYNTAFNTTTSEGGTASAFNYAFVESITINDNQHPGTTDGPYFDYDTEGKAIGNWDAHDMTSSDKCPKLSGVNYGTSTSSTTEFYGAYKSLLGDINALYPFSSCARTNSKAYFWNFASATKQWDLQGSRSDNYAVVLTLAFSDQPVPTEDYAVTATIDDSTHGSVTLNPSQITGIKAGTKYNVLNGGNTIKIGDTEDAPTVTYDSGNSTYVLDKWQYSTDGTNYVDLPDEADRLINANTEFRAITKSDTPTTNDAYAYLVNDNGQYVMHFAYDDQSGEKDNAYRLNHFFTDQSYDDGEIDLPGWISLDEQEEPIPVQFNSIKFDDSFSSYKPDTMAFWFYDQENLNINNNSFNNLDVSDCLDMSGLFMDSAIENFSSSWFSGQAQNLQRFASVFSGCDKLKTCELNKFKLDELKSKYSIYDLFIGCRELTKIVCDQDLSSYNTSPTTMDGVKYVFEECVKLKGQKGTSYKDDCVWNASYARPDGGPYSKTPGYFTKSDAPSTYDLTSISSNESLGIVDPSVVSDLSGTTKLTPVSENGQDCLLVTSSDGTDSKMLAKPTGDAYFDGWYISNKKIESEQTIDSATYVMAKFKRSTPVFEGLTFTAEKAGSTVSYSNNGGNAPNVLYSINNENWTTWNPDDPIKLENIGDEVYIKGDNSDGFSKSYDKYSYFEMDGKIAASGNITSLIDSTCKQMSLPSWCYSNLFKDCASLTEAPNLPATTLADHCYFYMFGGCSSLDEAVNLPATTLADFCYMNMFYSCSSLTKAPSLPAQALSQSCYYSMFQNCISLKEAPSLPAITLANSCYANMFSGCSSLVKAPSLPASILADSCYSSMFSECVSLEEAPSLPATSLADYCYSSMFASCTSITKAPSLSATSMKSFCYQYMFAWCTALTQPPCLPAKSLTYYCYDGMFFDCKSLNISTDAMGKKFLYFESGSEYDATRNMLSGTAGITSDPTENTQYYCQNVTPATYNINISSNDEKLGTVDPSVVSGLSGDTNLQPKQEDGKNYLVLTSAEDATITSTVTAAPAEGATFDGWYIDGEKIETSKTINSATEVTANFSGETPEYAGLTFTAEEDSTISYTNVGENKPNVSFSKNNEDWNDWGPGASVTLNKDEKIYVKGDNSDGFSTSDENYSHFSMTGKIAASGNIMSLIDNGQCTSSVIPCDFCFERMFKGCAELTSAPDLPAITLTQQCYKSMFGECTSLKKAPCLVADKLASSCYLYMFYGCSSLVNAPDLNAKTLAYGCYACMFQGCSSLKQSPELPAEILADYCYYCMFQGCSSFKQSPELPAETLADYCYCGMFQQCTALTETPDLPAETLANDCYRSMFEECSGLTVAHDLPATSLAEGCYYRMFYCCSLIDSPDLPAKNLATWCYGYMFAGCSNLVQPPILSAATLADSCYYAMFYSCTSLKVTTNSSEATAFLYYENGANDATGYMFYKSGGEYTDNPQVNSKYYYKSDVISLYDVTATIDDKTRGYVSPTAPIMGIEKNTNYTVSGNSITIGTDISSKTITYSPGDTGYVLDKWQYSIDNGSTWADLPEEGSRVINANTIFKALTKGDTPAVTKSLACTYDDGTLTTITYFVPAFSDAAELNDVVFYNSSDEVIDEISNGKCADMATMALYYHGDYGNDKKPVKASAPAGIKFYTTVDAAYNTAFNTDPDGGTATAFNQAFVDSVTIGFDEETSAEHPGTKDGPYFEYDADGKVIGNWDANEVARSANTCPTLNGVKYSNKLDDKNYFYGAYTNGNTSGYGILSSKAVYPWSSCAYSSEKAYSWYIAKRSENWDSYYNRTEIIGVVLSLTF